MTGQLTRRLLYPRARAALEGKTKKAETAGAPKSLSGVEKGVWSTRLGQGRLRAEMNATSKIETSSAWSSDNKVGEEMDRLLRREVPSGG